MSPCSCMCGLSWGRYHNNVFATYGGVAIPMIMLNSEFVASLADFQAGERDFELLDFTTGFVPSGSNTFMDETSDAAFIIVRELGPGPKMRCTHCNDTIQSMSQHDFVKCECGKSFIDGGGVYTRSGGNLEPIEEE